MDMDATLVLSPTHALIKVIKALYVDSADVHQAVAVKQIAWLELASALAKYDAAMCHLSARPLPLTSAPKPIHQWLETDDWAGPNDCPYVTPAQFTVQMERWWANLQPAWRDVGSRKDPAKTDWTPMHFTGDLGLSLFVSGLWWWNVQHACSEQPRAPNTRVATLMADVTWVVMRATAAALRAGKRKSTSTAAPSAKRIRMSVAATEPRWSSRRV
jgi:hypothetical protein